MAKEKKIKSQAPPVNRELLDVERDYRRETFVVEARPRLKRILFYTWVVVDVALVGFFVVYMALYLANGAFRDTETVARIGANIATMRSVSAERAAEPLRIRPVQTFALGGVEYDTYAVIENTNEEWYATFDYTFRSSQGDTVRQEGFVLPGEVKGLMALRQDFAARPTGVELVIDDLEWHRVPAGEVADVDAWLATRSNFAVTNAQYATDVELEGTNLPRASFTVRNNSPYSYWQAEFYVTIVRAGAVAGVNKVTIPGFASGEERVVSLAWFGEAPSSGTVVVLPNIQYFDAGVYMPPAGESGGDLRDNVSDRRR